MNSIAIRQKQIKDVLDEDGLYKKIVYDRMRNAVSSWDDVLKPKSLRDEDKELNVETSVEKLVGLIQKRISSLQSFVGDAKGAERRQLFSYITSYADVISMYNSIVRVSQNPSLNQQSKMAIITKIQSIQKDIDTLTVALNELIDYSFDNNEVDKDMVALINAFVAYNMIRQQLIRNKYEVISNQDISANVNSYILTLSQERRDRLSSLVDVSRSIKSRALNVPMINSADFDNRIQALESEYGFKLTRAEINKAKKLPAEELIKVVEGRKDVGAIDDEITQKQDEIKQADQDKKDKIRIRVADFARRNKEQTNLINGAKRQLVSSGYNKKKYESLKQKRDDGTATVDEATYVDNMDREIADFNTASQVARQEIRSINIEDKTRTDAMGQEVERVEKELNDLKDDLVRLELVKRHSMFPDAPKGRKSSRRAVGNEDEDIGGYDENPDGVGDEDLYALGSGMPKPERLMKNKYSKKISLAFRDDRNDMYANEDDD